MMFPLVSYMLSLLLMKTQFFSMGLLRTLFKKVWWSYSRIMMGLLEVPISKLDKPNSNLLCQIFLSDQALESRLVCLITISETMTAKICKIKIVSSPKS